TSRTPSVLGVFSFRNGAVTTTEAGVAGIRASSSFRVYAESSEDRGGSRDIETGMAIANPGTQAETLNLELLSMSGAPTGLRGTATVPAQGQIALFVNQIAGLASRQAVQGILRVSGSSSTSAIAVVGLRGRYNERGDFLITTTPPIDESGTPSTSELLLPHIVDGGGYNSQFVILSGAGGTSGNGLVQLWSQAGRPLLVRGDAPPAEPVPPCPTTSSYTDSIGDIFQAPAAAPVDSRNNVIMPGASSFTGQENLPADSFNSGPNDVVRHNINGNRGAVAQLYPNYSPSSPNLYAYLNNPENPCGPPSIGGETPDEPADTNLSDVPNEDTLNSLATTLVDNPRILGGESPNLPPITTTPGIPPGPCDPVAEWNGKRCDLPAGAFQGRDIIFVNGLMPDALRDVALGQPLPTWPNQPSGFLSPGGYWWSKALEAWERHYSRFFEQTGRKNRYLIIRYSTAQRLSVGRHAMLTQIDMAMKTGLNVVNPDPNDPRGTSGFCYAKCVIVTHSTGALLTDLTLATAADESLASTLGAVSYIPDFIQLHVALGGAISGSTWARAALIASNGLDPAGTTAYCHMMNLVLDLPLSTSCSPTGVFNSSILVDLEPIMAQSLWGPVIGAAPPGKRPIPTITITGAHHDSYLIAKRWIVLGQDDGVVNMDSGCGKNVPHHEWPSGFVPRHPILNTSSSVSPLVYDKGIDTLDSIDAASRATRYFREQTYEHLLSPYAFFPARVGAACTPYLSGWGMVEPLDSIVADPPAASPLNYYPNHYPLIQSGEKHFSLKGGDQAKYEDTLATSGRGVDIMNRPGGLGLVDRAIENILQEEVRGEEISFWLPINISVSTGSCPAQPPVAPNKWCKRIGAFRVLYNKKWYAWWVWKRTYHRLYDWRQTPAAEYMYRYVLPNP
ncbi:MAG: hypothetical protein HY646_09565, partial [Acidobacteria bacterium]|nr:hypothetical protein [Acidobacteriota bacterium]